MAASTRYQVHIRVEGEIGSGFSDMFGGLEVRAEPGGTTLIAGEIRDQAALHGLLAAARDLGLTLVTIETTALRQPAAEIES